MVTMIAYLDEYGRDTTRVNRVLILWILYLALIAMKSCNGRCVF